MISYFSPFATFPVASNFAINSRWSAGDQGRIKKDRMSLYSKLESSLFLQAVSLSAIILSPYPKIAGRRGRRDRAAGNIYLSSAPSGVQAGLCR